jgi:hypothetical protein
VSRNSSKTSKYQNSQKSVKWFSSRCLRTNRQTEAAELQAQFVIVNLKYKKSLPLRVLRHCRVVIDKHVRGLKKYAQFWTGKRNFGDRLFCYKNVHHTVWGRIMGFCCEGITSFGLKSLTTCWTTNLLQERFRIANRTQRCYWFRLDRSMKHCHFKNTKLQFVTVLNNRMKTNLWKPFRNLICLPPGILWGLNYKTV